MSINNEIRVERYSFTLLTKVPLGKPCNIHLTDSPSTKFQPQFFMGNIHLPGLVIIDEFTVDGKSILRGETTPFDLSEFNPLGVGNWVDMQPIGPGNRVVIKGEYTGAYPPGTIRGWQFWKRAWWRFHWINAKLNIACSFRGPAA